MDASSMNLRDELRRSYQYGNKDISHNEIRKLKASLSEYLIQYIMPTIIGTCDETECEWLAGALRKVCCTRTLHNLLLVQGSRFNVIVV